MERIDPYKLLVGNDPDSVVFLLAACDMPEFGINDGDYVVVDRKGCARDGKLVAVWVDGELRIMRLVRQSGVFLEADGKRLERTGRKHVYVWGVVKWILRELF